jgi:hypothetical protein
LEASYGTVDGVPDHVVESTRYTYEIQPLRRVGNGGAADQR